MSTHRKSSEPRQNRKWVSGEGGVHRLTARTDMCQRNINGLPAVSTFKTLITSYTLQPTSTLPILGKVYCRATSYIRTTKASAVSRKEKKRYKERKTEGKRKTD